MSLFQLISPEQKKLLRKEKMSSFIKPMLAQTTNNIPFSDKKWIFEPKLDGERCLLFKNGNTVILKSRNNKLLNESYPEIVTIAKKLALPNCIIDGEIVAFKDKVSNFSLLQERFGVDYTRKISAPKIPISYYAFDILFYDQYLTTNLPLLTRKTILKNLIPFKGIFRYMRHKKNNGISYFKQACKNKWEGLIAKKIESTYISKRSPQWLKLKCINEQEFVIGGYTQPTRSRINFGALLLGYYENGKLHYAGKVGTGFNDIILNELGALLKKYTTTKNPFTNYDLSIHNVHWVKPILVGEIQFTEWTSTNKLRHPSFLGLRRDKIAKNVKKT